MAFPFSPRRVWAGPAVGCCVRLSPPSTGVGGTGGGLLRWPSPTSMSVGGTGVGLHPALAALDERGRDRRRAAAAGPRRPRKAWRDGDAGTC